MEACLGSKDEYYKCLSKSGRIHTRCAHLEPPLRKCEETFAANFCIDEGIDLMKCSRRPDSSMCTKEFFAMRECNRPGGAQMVWEGDKLVVVPGKESLFVQKQPPLIQYTPSVMEFGLTLAPTMFKAMGEDRTLANAPLKWNNTNIVEALTRLQEEVALENYKEKWIGSIWPDELYG
eukprot:Platyproteum_vivax@DN3220_c0_g1_i1.p1